MNASQIKVSIIKRSKELFRGRFASLASAKINEPVAMYDQNKVQRYWFTGLIINTKIAGMVIQDLEGKIVIAGSVTPNVTDNADKIDQNFLDQPAQKFIAEIKNNFLKGKMGVPFFSFDKVPQRWGWCVMIEQQDKNEVAVLISSSGWYVMKDKDLNYEG